MADQAAILAKLKVVLEAMLAEDEKISARAVIKRMPGLLKNPSDVTRNQNRNKLFTTYKERQEVVWQQLEGVHGRSRSEVELELAKARADLKQAESDLNLVIASHRAALLVVGELGGAPKWAEFFEGYRAALERLRHLRAVPASDADDQVGRAASTR